MASHLPLNAADKMLPHVSKSALSPHGQKGSLWGGLAVADTQLSKGQSVQYQGGLLYYTTVCPSHFLAGHHGLIHWDYYFRSRP